MSLDMLTSMTLFRDSIECGSMAAAGRKNNVSPEMTSRHLKALESRLGVRLINRSTRQLNLTSAGQIYFEHCHHILSDIAEVERSIEALQNEPRGTLKIAAPLAFTTSTLTPAINAYMDRHPKVILKFELSEQDEDLLAGGFDLALRLGDLPDSSLIAHRLGYFPLILVASPLYLAAKPAFSQVEQLNEHSFLIYTKTAQPELLTLEKNNQYVEIGISGTLHSSDIVLLTNLAVFGKGLLLAPSFVVDTYIKQGQLVQILPEWTARGLPFHALVPHRNLMPITARSFIDFLQEWFDYGRYNYNSNR